MSKYCQLDCWLEAKKRFFITFLYFVSYERKRGTENNEIAWRIQAIHST